MLGLFQFNELLLSSLFGSSSLANNEKLLSLLLRLLSFHVTDEDLFLILLILELSAICLLSRSPISFNTSTITCRILAFLPVFQ